MVFSSQIKMVPNTTTICNATKFRAVSLTYLEEELAEETEAERRLKCWRLRLPRTTRPGAAARSGCYPHEEGEERDVGRAIAGHELRNGSLGAPTVACPTR